MDDFPARLAELLESTATKVRALTVDRVANVIRVTTLGIIAATLALMAGIFLLLTAYRALEIPLGRGGALGVFGGLFAVGGALLWMTRTKDATP
ncbi:hypothetical protein BH23ACT5_BH23ACT5_07150 [soil metagenome]